MWSQELIRFVEHQAPKDLVSDLFKREGVHATTRGRGSVGSGSGVVNTGGGGLFIGKWRSRGGRDVATKETIASRSHC